MNSEKLWYNFLYKEVLFCTCIYKLWDKFIMGGLEVFSFSINLTSLYELTITLVFIAEYLV